MIGLTPEGAWVPGGRVVHGPCPECGGPTVTDGDSEPTRCAACRAASLADAAPELAAWNAVIFRRRDRAVS